MVYFAFFLGFGAILFNLYIIFSYVRCKFGKYPLFICSMGEAKKVTLKEAEKIILAHSDIEKIVDLGCGNGSLLLPLAQKFPEHEFFGIEWDWFVYLLARFRGKNLRNLHIVYGDFMKQDWKRYHLILCYVGNDIANDVANKILNECNGNTYVISEAFSLPKLVVEREVSAPTYKMPLKIFVYRLR